MKKRFKNWKTTVMGVIIFAFGLGMWYMGKVELVGGLSLIVLGWVFITAKDTLIEGITAGLFKIPPK
jgi:hypothetical protein